MPVSVSVIIPCFNQGKFVEEAVDSVLAQSYPNFEIIIVNDGSTDKKTNQLLQSYNRPKTRVISTDNQGLAAARNSGIKTANGEYILPLDADDRIGPTYLERAVSFLDERPELGIVYCRAKLFGAVDTEWLLPQFSLQEMLLDNVIFCSALFRFEDWERIGGYDENLLHGWEDYDFWLSLLELGREVFQLPEILFYYRVASDSMVRARPRQDKLDSFTAIYKKHRQLFSDHIEVWIDKLLDVRNLYYEARLVPGSPGTVDNEAAFIRKIDESTRRLEFDLVDMSSAEMVFYPVNEYCVVAIERISITGDTGGKEHILSWTSNADFVDKGVCYFANTEPAIMFSSSAAGDAVQRNGKLIITLQYQGIGKDCLPLLSRHFQHELDRCRELATTDSVENSALSPPKSSSWLQVNVGLIRRNLKWLVVFLGHNSHYRKVAASGLFDSWYYLQNDPQLDPLLQHPMAHYVEKGWQEGRDPNGLLDSNWYLQQNPEAQGSDPILHYCKIGCLENKNPSPLFFTRYYREIYPECMQAGKTPLSHYLGKGWKEGKNPNPLFDSSYYLENNPEVATAGMNPLAHYFHQGFAEKFHPLQFFDLDYYLEDNPSLAIQRIPPLLHFINFGADEGRSPNRFFDPVFYRNEYGVGDSSGSGPFLHYVTTGCDEQLRPNRLFDPVYYARTYLEFAETHSYPLLHYQEKGVLLRYYPCKEVEDLATKPVISIITPVFNTDELQLRKCIHSVFFQAYPHWELCLADDGSTASHVRKILEEYAARDKRIKICFLAENQGIVAASNEAAALATGDYLGFVDHDDELTLDALYEMVLAINKYDPEVLYSDEDLVNRDSRYLETFFKPDFNPELLLCHNYITHFLVTRRSLFEEAGGFAAGSDGAQDYDLLLKLAERTDGIHHISRSIYKWRATETSTSINHNQKNYADAAGLRVLQSAIERRGIRADVCSGQWQYYYELHRKVGEVPQVTILVMLPDGFQHAGSWLQKLVKGIRYQHYDIQLLQRSSLLTDTDLQVTALSGKVTLHTVPDNESEAAALNRIADSAACEHLVFLKGGTLPGEENWLEILLGYSQAGDCGVVGGMVVRDDDLVENLAVPDITDRSCRKFHSFLAAGSYHLNGIVCPQNVIAVSFDFCMVSHQLFEDTKGFDYDSFPQHLFDLDLCLRLRGEGVENVFTPFCRAACSDRQNTNALSEQCPRERTLFQKRWRSILIHHPYYNENRLFQEQGISRNQWLKWIAGVAE